MIDKSYLIGDDVLVLNETNLRDGAIEYNNGCPYVDISKLPISKVQHAYGYRMINWHKVLLLIDVSDKSKKFATLVVEEGLNFYLVKRTTTALINEQLKRETLFSNHMNRSICEQLGFKHKFPIILSAASLIALPNANKKSRTYSWLNCNLIQCCAPYSSEKISYLSHHQHDTLLIVKASKHYLLNKYAEVRKMQSFFIQYHQRNDQLISMVEDCWFHNPCLHRNRLIYFDEEIFQSVYQQSCLYFLEEYQNDDK